MIKDVVVHLDASDAGRARMMYAYAIAERHGARLTGIHVIAPVDVPPIFRPSRVAEVAEAMERRAEAEAEATEAMFRQEAARHAGASAWRTFEGPMTRHICEAARSADLVIVGQYEAEGTPERHPLYLADELVTRCGRPLLVTPDEVAAAAGLRRALVAWDGSREAVRAVHDALPLLVEAKTKVDLIVIDADALAFDALVDHLLRHGVDVENRTHVHDHHPVGPTLVDQLAAGNFDLLVMGAYGHPAWLELLFGGATKSALMRAPTPVLASH